MASITETNIVLFDQQKYSLSGIDQTLIDQSEKSSQAFLGGLRDQKIKKEQRIALVINILQKKILTTDEVVDNLKKFSKDTKKVSELSAIMIQQFDSFKTTHINKCLLILLNALKCDIKKHFDDFTTLPPERFLIIGGLICNTKSYLQYSQRDTLLRQFRYFLDKHPRISEEEKKKFKEENMSPLVESELDAIGLPDMDSKA